MCGKAVEWLAPIRRLLARLALDARERFCERSVKFVKFSADSKPKNGEFSTPHSLALIEDLDMLCVADRDNERIQCFTAGLTPRNAHRRAHVEMGKLITKAEGIGRVMAIREKRKFSIMRHFKVKCLLFK